MRRAWIFVALTLGWMLMGWAVTTNHWDWWKGWRFVLGVQMPSTVFAALAGAAMRPKNL